MQQRPNIVVIIADDMGYGDLGCFGNPDVQTPFLDQMANEGVCLTQHYSASPMCAPARAGFLTGKYPHRTGAIDVVECRGLDRISLKEKTIADLFKKSGYRTGMIGKWHNGAVDQRYHPNSRGFDEFAGFRGGFIDYWDWILDYNGSYNKADGRYLTDVFTQEAVGFITRHRSHPFFLCVTYNAPHMPLQAPEAECKTFREMEKLSDVVSTIYAMNKRMDAGIGRIIETLKTHGIDDNTLVLFTSDNGPQFIGGEDPPVRYNGNFNGCKGIVLEGGIRVPAIVRWPGGLPGRVSSDEFFHFADWLPTLTGVAGLEVPQGLDIDGQDASALLQGEKSNGSPLRFWQWNRYEPVQNCNAAMRDGPWKLYQPCVPEAMAKIEADNQLSEFIINHPDQATENDILRTPVDRELSEPPEPSLFNLDEDPYEHNDLAVLHPERLEIMKNKLELWFESVLRDRAEIGQ